MDLSKPDTLCVYCGTNIEDLDKAKELLQILADIVKQDFTHRELHYQIISFLHKRRPQPLDTVPPM